MITIKSLFSAMQNSEVLIDRISGGFTLVGKSIVWTYTIDNDIEDIGEDEEIDEDDFKMGDVISLEEILNDVYEQDLEEINDSICELEGYDDLIFTEPRIKDTSISFKIQF